MTTIRIIGIDPGLRRTGWGVIDWDGVRMAYVASGAVTSEAGEPLAARLCALFAGLDTVLAAWGPREAAVEQTFMTRDGQATLKLGQARGVALLAPARAGLTVAEYAPNLIKKTVTGAGHAEKEQIRVMLGFLLPRARPDSADEADALAVAITHAHHRRAAQIVATAMVAQPRKARA
ncbi:MAG: crossover junction endodeoxyribonuclease RuvC [Hyphomicrobiales bacterium]|nr:crossover junction endodeoxyribonuclease RuvC [Hyphomicrobiales bacterium]